jgi:glutamate synthase (NADPH/NADH) large chain
MAMLGFRTVDEMVGRVDRLRERDDARVRAPAGVGEQGVMPVVLPAASMYGPALLRAGRQNDDNDDIRLDVSRLLVRPSSRDSPRRTRSTKAGTAGQLDHTLIEAAVSAIASGRAVTFDVTLRNRDRAFGALLSWAVVRHVGTEVLPPDSIVVRCTGSAGQSFAAFLAAGISLHLSGDANDYVAKGLSGGRIVVTTPADAGFGAADNIVIGNVALYGATAGEAYFNGQGGERFAVRNSGAMAVVEGVGDHACEYMTGGVVVVLGATGRNFAAGMSGGEAYVLDEAGDFHERLNPAMVQLEAMDDARDQRLLRRLLANHATLTGSPRAAAILADWNKTCPQFVKVMPRAFAQAVADARSNGRELRPSPPPRVRLTA